MAAESMGICVVGSGANAERLEAVARQFPGVQVRTSLVEALALPGVDAAVVSTPAASHAAVTETCLRAGKHVLVEKPLTTTVEDGDIFSPRVVPSEPLGNQARHFLECVRNRTRPLTDGPAGLDVVSVMEAIDRSLAAGGAPSPVQPTNDPLDALDGAASNGNGRHEDDQRRGRDRRSGRTGAVLAVLASSLLPATADAGHLSRPTLSGTAEVGRTVRADIRGRSPESWRWYRCETADPREDCPVIDGAQGQEYRFVEADMGRRLRASAYHDGHHSDRSRPSAVIRPATPLNTVAPALTSIGTPSGRPPSTVSWTLGTWVGTSALELEIQRCQPEGRDCDTVTSGAVAYRDGLDAAYVVRPADVGHVLVLAVQAPTARESRRRTTPTPVVVAGTEPSDPPSQAPPPVVTPSAGATPPPATPPVPSPPPPPPPAPPTPPSSAGVVKELRAKLDVNVVRLTWRSPKGATVVVVRRLGRRPRHATDGKVVYLGKARATRDAPRSTRRVWYAVFLVDTANPTATSVAREAAYASLPRVMPRLLAPLEGVRTGRTVRFAWRPVVNARYYNVQVWNRTVTRRIVTRWPVEQALTLRLSPGRYRWYVYPGYRRMSSVRYGKLLGQGSFSVR